MVNRTTRSWLQSVLVLGGLAAVSTAVSAHGVSTTTVSGITVSFLAVLSASTAIGSLGGFTTLVLRSRRSRMWFGNSRFAGVVGLALVGLAVLLAYPGLRARPLVSIGGILAGGVAALGLSVSVGDRSIVAEADTAFGVLAIHHVLEGVALAATYAAGSRVGLAAAVILTLHTIAETAVVGGLYTATNRIGRGLLAVVVMQVGYVGAAIGALTMTVSVSAVESIVPAIAGGVLLCIGVRHASAIMPGVPDFH